MQVQDLPSDITLPSEVTLHPGMRLGCEPPPELRRYVLAAPTLSAKLGSGAAPHCAAFAGDGHHDYYYGMICLFFSVEFDEHIHKERSRARLRTCASHASRAVLHEFRLFSAEGRTFDYRPGSPNSSVFLDVRQAETNTPTTTPRKLAHSCRDGASSLSC